MPIYDIVLAAVVGAILVTVVYVVAYCVGSILDR